jgi:[ribosomal protein S5]-alanine N-acetyltransferase
MRRIETKQLVIRDFDAMDWDAINTILSDPFVTEHMHYATWTEAQRQEWFNWCLTNNHEPQPDVYSWAIVEKTTMHTIGWFGIGAASHPNIVGERSFGYFLARDRWGRGYMTEALKAILEYEFTTLGASYISASCRTVNPASASVMEKAGMQHIKIAIEDDGNGNDVECHFYGIYNPHTKH